MVLALPRRGVFLYANASHRGNRSLTNRISPSDYGDSAFCTAATAAVVLVRDLDSSFFLPPFA